MRNNHRLTLLSAALAALWMAGATTSASACNTNVKAILDLKTCAYSGAAGVALAGPCVPAAVTATCPAASWKQATLSIDIPATCTQANVLVEFEGTPSGFSVNLGDSATNDAYAGGTPGTTLNAAELWVLHETLQVATNVIGGIVDSPALSQDLSLTNGALKFQVRNQFLSFGQPYGWLSSPATKRFYAIPDSDGGDGPGGVAGDGRKIYLGLNRVITARPDRSGCGARRAIVSFQ
jgi:hypothetical protein